MKKEKPKPNITIRQIAKHANVSLGTVSHVLNGSAVVRETLRTRVLEAMSTLSYEPSQLARGLRGNSINLMGMIIQDVTNPFFPAIIRGAEDLAYKHGQRLVLCNTDNDADKEISYLADLRCFRPSGMLIIPGIDSKIIESIRPTDPPIVFVARCPASWKGDFVAADNEGGGYQAASHLLQLGHRNMAVITGPLHLSTAVARLNGFKTRLLEEGISLMPEYIHEARFNSESGYTASLRLFQMLPRPTAIFASNDLLAFGVLAAIRHLNLRCPEDISVVGFDNLDFAEYSAPALTTIHESGYQMGATACRLLLDRMKEPQKAVGRIILPTELRIRSSTQPLRNAVESPAHTAR